MAIWNKNTETRRRISPGRFHQNGKINSLNHRDMGEPHGNIPPKANKRILRWDIRWRQPLPNAKVIGAVGWHGGCPKFKDHKAAQQTIPFVGYRVIDLSPFPWAKQPGVPYSTPHHVWHHWRLRTSNVSRPSRARCDVRPCSPMVVSS